MDQNTEFLKDSIDEKEKAKWKEILREEILKEEEERILKNLSLNRRGKTVILLPSMREINPCNLTKFRLNYRVVQFGTKIIAVYRNSLDSQVSDQSKRIKKKINNNKGNFTCLLCNLSLNSEPVLKRHMAGKKHLLNLAKFEQEKKEKKNAGFNEEKKITMLSDGKWHEVLQREDHLYCSKCDVKCPTAINMSFHLSRVKHNA